MVGSVRIHRMMGGLIMGILILISGCRKTTRDYDTAELRDPMIRRAQAKVREGNKDAAVTILNKALAKKPGLAQAHLEIALLYDDFKKDYIRAIYHYQRYLELRPQTEKREMIEEWIRGAKMSFTATLSERLPGMNKRVHALEQENARLLSALQQVRKSLAKQIMVSSGSSSGTGTVHKKVFKPKPKAEDKPASHVSSGQVYRVQPNDTLSMIAAKVYEDPRKWKQLYDANRETLAGPHMLRVGQVLIVPIESGGNDEQ